MSIAERLWTRSIQLKCFPLECQGLAKGKGEVCLKQLTLYWDEEGIICCQGRLSESSLPASANNPILLLSRHQYTALLILEHHKLVHHNGIRETLRQSYWIIHGREVVKQVIKKCVLCLKF